MATRAYHKFWMKITAVGIGAFGPLFFLGTMPAFNEPARWGLDLLAWPLDKFPSYQFPRDLVSVCFDRRVSRGLGRAGRCLSIWVYDFAPEPVRRSLVVSICAWFLLDSFGSVTSGNWPNVIWNVLVIVVLIGPMWWPAKD